MGIEVTTDHHCFMSLMPIQLCLLRLLNKGYASKATLVLVQTKIINKLLSSIQYMTKASSFFVNLLEISNEYKFIKSIQIE